MGNTPSSDEALASRVLRNSSAGHRRLDRLVGQHPRSVAVGPRGDSLLLSKAVQGARPLGVFFVMNGRVKHIDDITYEKGGHLFLKHELRV